MKNVWANYKNSCAKQNSWRFLSSKCQIMSSEQFHFSTKRNKEQTRNSFNNFNPRYHFIERAESIKEKYQRVKEMRYFKKKSSLGKDEVFYQNSLGRCSLFK